MTADSTKWSHPSETTTTPLAATGASHARLNRRDLVRRAGLLAGAGAIASRGGVAAHGAAGSRVPRAASARRQGDPIEITVWVAFPELDTFLTEVGPRYSEVRPDVKIVHTLFPQRALEEKVAAALPAGQGPDLLEMDRHEIFTYFLNGEILPITGETADFITQGWPEFAVAGSTAPDGQLFALPWITSPKMMFYNQGMFEEAGIAAPPETVDEMMQMAEQLTQRDANGTITTQGIDLRLSGGGFGTSQKYWTQAMIPHGAAMLAADGDRFRAGYDNEQGAAALNLYLDALYAREVSTFEAKHDAEGFGLGQAAMFQRESWVVDYLAANAPDLRYGVFPMPKGPGGWGTVPNTLGLGLTSSTQQEDEALEFARWLMNDENTAALYDISGWQPWRTENVDFGDLFQRKPVLQQFIDVLNLEGHQLYDYENIGPIAEIHARLADRLVQSFQEEGLTGNQDALMAELGEMAEETNRILADWDLLAE